MSKTVGDKIRNIRTNILGLSMSDFGKEIDSNVKSGTVANWETGKNLPNNNRLLKIAKLGNTTVDELLRDNCQLCSGQEYKASWYPDSQLDVLPWFNVTEDKKLIVSLNDSEGNHLGFVEIDINYCPEHGRKL